MKSQRIQFAIPLLLTFGLLMPGVLVAQQQNQQQQKQPLEYIESSSPIAGGGVVTSVYVPGRGAPSYQRQNTNPPQSTFQNRNQSANAATNSQREALMRQASFPNQAAQSSTQRGSNGQSVLSPAAAAANRGAVGSTQNQTGFYTNPNGNLYSNQQAYAANPRIASNGYAANAYGSNVAALRPGCAGCGVGGNLGGLAPPPRNLPNAASFAPSLGSIGQPGAMFNQVPVVPNGRSTYTPIIPFKRNFPANTYAGQGIFGSPKLYVGGQPIRNFFRYMIIP